MAINCCERCKQEGREVTVTAFLHLPPPDLGTLGAGFSRKSLPRWCSSVVDVREGGLLSSAVGDVLEGGLLSPAVGDVRKGGLVLNSDPPADVPLLLTIMFMRLLLILLPATQSW